MTHFELEDFEESNPIKKINFFKSIDSFVDLQIQFLEQNLAYDEYNSIKRFLQKEDFYILEEATEPVVNDKFSFNSTIQPFYFYKDFLPKIISDLSKEFLSDFYKELREDYLESQKDRRKFLNDKKKLVASIIDNLNQFEFMEFSLFTELKSQLCQIEIAVNSPALYNDKPSKMDKLSLIGWKEQDLLMFFNFLRKEKIIDINVTDADLGNFIERNFCVEKDEVVSSLERLNKKLNYLYSGKKDTVKSEIRLRRLFNKF